MDRYKELCERCAGDSLMRHAAAVWHPVFVMCVLECTLLFPVVWAGPPSPAALRVARRQEDHTRVLP
jgi:hypothetical protein